MTCIEFAQNVDIYYNAWFFFSKKPGQLFSPSGGASERLPPLQPDEGEGRGQAGPEHPLAGLHQRHSDAGHHTGTRIAIKYDGKAIFKKYVSTGHWGRGDHRGRPFLLGQVLGVFEDGAGKGAGETVSKETTLVLTLF